MTSRELARAARRFADQQTGRIADLPTTRSLIVTVSDVTGAVVTVNWRGQDLVATAVCASYTPATGDRVLVQLIENQLVVIDRLV